MSTRRVLVTGGSGFIAGHCILQLVDAGRPVRTTVRSLGREDRVRSGLATAGLSDQDALDVVVADLLADDGWADAMRDVDVVLHVASPVTPGHVANEDEVILPAREGTLRVLRAARDAGVRRVVMTSAFHAVGWGHPHDDHVFTEDDWTVVDGPGVDAYGKSKTLAERAAWDFVGQEPTGPELVTMLPVAVMGPALGGVASGANHLVERLVTGRMPGLPNLYLPIVDVRDVARAHLLCADAPAAAGRRFLLSNGPALPLAEVADTAREALGAAGARVPRRRIPDLALRLAGLVSPQMRSVAADLGYARRTSSEAAREVFGWDPRDPHEAIAAAARSLVSGR